MGNEDLKKTLDAIVEISKLVTSSKNFFDIKDEVVEKMLQVIPPTKACVNIFERDEYNFAYLVCDATLDKIPEMLSENKTSKGIKIPLAQYPTYIRESVKTKTPIYIKKLDEDMRAQSEIDMAKVEGYVARAVFPLISSNKTVGFLTCFMSEGEKLLDSDIDFVNSVASLLGLSIEITRYNGDIDRIVKKLREAISSIGTATDELYKNKGIDSFLTMISEQIAKLTNSEACFIILQDNDARINTMARFGEVEDFSSIMEFILEEAEAGWSKNRYLASSLPQSVVDTGVNTLMYDTLKKGEEVLGYLIAVNSKKYYDDDLKILGIFSTEIVLSLIMYLSSKKVFESRLMERDLEIVGKQQELIMSDKHMKLNDGNISIDYYYSPSRQIGGDFCKLLEIDEHRAMVFIADVMGHGILSNYFVAMMKGVLKTLISENLGPGEVINRMNKILFNDLDALNLFITARIMYLDFEKNIAISSNAGHLYPMVFKKNGESLECEMFQTDEGIPIGVMEDSEYEEYEYDIKDIEMIAFYTDGIIEAGDMDEKDFGTENLERFLMENFEKTGEEICKELPVELKKFTGKDYTEDDVMLVLVKKVPQKENV